MCSNYISVELTDIFASLLSVGAIVAFLRVWQPGDPLLVEGEGGGRPAMAGAAEHDAAHEATVRRRDGTGKDTPREIFEAYAPYLIIIVVFALAQLGPIKDLLANGVTSFTWPGLHDVENAAGEPPTAVEYNLNWLPAAGTLLLLCGLITMVVLRVSPARALRVRRDAQPAQVGDATVAAVLGLAYVMNLSAQTLSIGTWIAGAGGFLAFRPPSSAGSAWPLRARTPPRTPCSACCR